MSYSRDREERERSKTVSTRLIQTIVSIGLSAVCLGGEPALAADQIIPIGEILSNPAGFHRKVVRMQGRVHAIGTRSGRDVTAQSLCGQDFDLEDSTGTIRVVYLVRCQADAAKTEPARDGMVLQVEALIEAPSANVKSSSGSEFTVTALARQILPASP
jgi:hypothetical protein